MVCLTRPAQNTKNTLKTLNRKLQAVNKDWILFTHFNVYYFVDGDQCYALQVEGDEQLEQFVSVLTLKPGGAAVVWFGEVGAFVFCEVYWCLAADKLQTSWGFCNGSYHSKLYESPVALLFDLLSHGDGDGVDCG